MISNVIVRPHNLCQAKIHGDRDVFVQEGSDINLTCTALSSPEQPESVKWRHNNLDLHRSTRGGIAIVTEKRRRTSVLLMYRLVLVVALVYILTYIAGDKDLILIS